MKQYRLTIRRDGIRKYYMEDGTFDNPKSKKTVKIFNRRIDAMMAFLKLARARPADFADWYQDIEEV